MKIVVLKIKKRVIVDITYYFFKMMGFMHTGVPLSWGVKGSRKTINFQRAKPFNFEKKLSKTQKIDLKEAVRY